MARAGASVPGSDGAERGAGGRLARWIERHPLGALLIGLAEQFGSVYLPTYAIVFSFLIMVLVLAFRPQGLSSLR